MIRGHRGSCRETPRKELPNERIIVLRGGCARIVRESLDRGELLRELE